MVFTTVKFLSLLGLVSVTAAAQVVEPGGTDVDKAVAITSPDEYAWRLFLFLNRAAKPGIAGQAEGTKQSIKDYVDDHDVVWETWALSSGLDIEQPDQTKPPAVVANHSEVFKNPATMPVSWDALDRGPARPKVLSQDFKSSNLISLLPMNLNLFRNPTFHVLIAPIGSDPAEDESRMNKSTYDAIRGNGLYSVEGIEAAALKARTAHNSSLVTFEPTSKEVKARWVHLKACDANPACTDKKRYHWRTITRNSGAKEIWGLVSLHIITKDLPNWFWADFGHIDCEQGQGACSDFKAETPLRDSTTPATNGVRPETKGSKWEFYRLRGTQTDFETSNGIDTILSNPVVEATFQKSSCMTCHSYASSAADASAPRRGTSLPLIVGAVGVRNAGSHQDDTGKPNCQRFYSPGGQPSQQCGDAFGSVDPIYLQTDFLWSIPFRAFSSHQ